MSCERGLLGPLQGAEALLYAGARERLFRLFLGSSAVEHSTVNRMVAGSNPARGAKKSHSPSTFPKLMVLWASPNLSVGPRGIICRVPSNPRAHIGGHKLRHRKFEHLIMALRLHTAQWHPAPIHSVLLQA